MNTIWGAPYYNYSILSPEQKPYYNYEGPYIIETYVLRSLIVTLRDPFKGTLF